MQKILIITYYFPPVKGAAPWRPYSWAKEFKKHGLAPTVLTRHWKGDESHWDDFVKDNNTPMNYEVTDEYEIYHLPSAKLSILKLIENNLLKLKLFRKGFYFLSNIFGYHNTEADGFATFSGFLKTHLASVTYDYILVTYPPSNLLMLLPLLKKISKAKIILDIRDLWNNHILDENYSPGLNQQFIDASSKFYAQKYLEFSDLITAVTPSFLPTLKTITNKKCLLIYNGFEEHLFADLKKEPSSKFRISYIGNLYPVMKLDIILKGLNLFVSDKEPEKVELKFIGVASNATMKSLISNALPERFLTITPMVNKRLALQHTVNSEVLLQYGWKGFKGMIGTKTFDYIASGNNILLAPGDHDIVDDLLSITKTGKSVETAQQFSDALNNWYEEWLQTGSLKYEGDKTEIHFYTRENQAALLAEHIKKLK
jgi:glycosyltransferase involved in cell wall biosynthesis